MKLNPQVKKEWTDDSGAASPESIAKKLSDLIQEILVEGPKLDLLNKKQETPLMVAARNNLLFAIEELVGAGASVAASGSKGVSDPLTYLCSVNGDVECAQALIARL